MVECQRGPGNVLTIKQVRVAVILSKHTPIAVTNVPSSSADRRGAATARQHLRSC